MDKDIQLALERQPDYSERFTQRMEFLRASISRSLEVPVYLQSDMNYSASQKLSIVLDGNQRACDMESDSHVFKLLFLVSSRGPFFTFVCLHRVGQNEWARMSNSKECKGHDSIIEQVNTELEKEGLKALSEDILEETAVGHTTLMDGAPATVFQVLFSELVS